MLLPLACGQYLIKATGFSQNSTGESMSTGNCEERHELSYIFLSLFFFNNCLRFSSLFFI